MSHKRSQDFFNTSDSPTTTASLSSYSTSMHTPSSLTSTQLYPHHSYKKDFPLTLENVAKIQDADPLGTPLARYCYELNSSPASFTNSIHSTGCRKKRNISRQSRDNVLESPRLLPFPYHNDSFFLPTAEHDYPGKGGIMAADTSSSVASLHTYESQIASISRPSSSYQSHYRRQQTCYSPHPQKRSRPSIQVTPELPIPDGAVSQKKHRGDRTHLVNRLKNNFRRNRNTKFNFDFKIDSFLLAKTFGFQQKYKELNESKKKLSWFEKIKKLFKKDDNKGTSTSGPVWYNQFNCTPTPTTLLT